MPQTRQQVKNLVMSFYSEEKQDTMEELAKLQEKKANVFITLEEETTLKNIRCT